MDHPFHFPGLPAFTIQNDEPEVNEEPQGHHFSLVSSPFLVTNKIPLKSSKTPAPKTVSTTLNFDLPKVKSYITGSHFRNKREAIDFGWKPASLLSLFKNPLRQRKRGYPQIRRQGSRRRQVVNRQSPLSQPEIVTAAPQDREVDIITAPSPPPTAAPPSRHQQRYRDRPRSEIRPAQVQQHNTHPELVRVQPDYAAQLAKHYSKDYQDYNEYPEALVSQELLKIPKEGSKPVVSSQPLPPPTIKTYPSKPTNQPSYPEQTVPKYTHINEYDYDYNDEYDVIPTSLPFATKEPTSLQAILANHQIHTNVLKTRPRTQNVAYPQFPPSENLTPDTDGDSYFYYTNQEPMRRLQNVHDNPMTLNRYQQMIDESKTKEYLADIEPNPDSIKREDVEKKPEKKTLAETAVIALKLSEKVLDLYKSMSPYIA